MRQEKIKFALDIFAHLCYYENNETTNRRNPFMKDQQWNFQQDLPREDCAPGVWRKILAYSDDLMCVENHFEAEAVGALHSHPHTQIAYVASGKFEFEIDGVKKVIAAGDSVLCKDAVVHGCRCLEAGVLLDIFTPMREDFVKE